MNINNILPTTQNHFTNPEVILSAVCETWNVSREDLLGPSRRQPLTFARHLAMWLVYEHSHLSLASVGVLFGNRHHTSVYAAKKRIKKFHNNAAVQKLIKAVRAHCGIDDNH